MAQKTIVHYRDVRSGKGTYVTEEYAKKHPDYTVKEHDKRSVKKS
jgi:hypothetical protein